MFIKGFAVTLVLLSGFVFGSPVLAGGGPVSLMAFPNRPFDQTKTFILQADVYTEGSCSSVKPTFAFKDSVSGDSITPFTPPQDGTHITRHFYTDSRWKEICTTYVEAKSGVAKQRTAVVTVKVDGKTEVRETPVAYGDDSYSRQIQSFGRVNDYDNTPHPDVYGEKHLGGSKREVNLQ